MNKIRERHVEYSYQVLYNKYMAHRKAQEKYMNDRCAKNFDRVKHLFDELDRYNELHKRKLYKYWEWWDESVKQRR